MTSNPPRPPSTMALQGPPFRLSCPADLGRDRKSGARIPVIVEPSSHLRTLFLLVLTRCKRNLIYYYTAHHLPPPCSPAFAVLYIPITGPPNLATQVPPPPPQPSQWGPTTVVFVIHDVTAIDSVFTTLQWLHDRGAQRIRNVTLIFEHSQFTLAGLSATLAMRPSLMVSQLTIVLVSKRTQIAGVPADGLTPVVRELIAHADKIWPKLPHLEKLYFSLNIRHIDVVSESVPTFQTYIL